MEELGERIRQLRAKLNLPRAEFALLIGISPTALFNYESGNRAPGADVLLRICEETSVTPKWLLLGIGPVYEADLQHSCGIAASEIVNNILSSIDAKIDIDKKIILIKNTLLYINEYIINQKGKKNDNEYLEKELIQIINNKKDNDKKKSKKTIQITQSAHGNNIVQVGESVSGGININTVTKKVNVAVQPPKGSIGANALLAERIKGMFNELGLRREERFGKTAYAVMYSEFKKDFEIPRNQKYTAYLLWPESRAEEIITYLEEKLNNTIKGRKIRAASRKGHTLPYLLAETTRLHKLLGWDEQTYRTHLQYLFGVTSRSDLTQSQLTNYIEYLKKLIDEEQ